jgi:hypothetical protein
MAPYLPSAPAPAVPRLAQQTKHSPRVAARTPRCGQNSLAPTSSGREVRANAASSHEHNRAARQRRPRKRSRCNACAPSRSSNDQAVALTGVALSWLWLTAVALAGVYFVYSATVEEHYLTEQFPDTYPVHKRSTKMLVPFIL